MARALFSIGVLQLATMVVALLRAKALSWQLGPAGFGVVATVDQVVTSLVQIGALGLPFTALRDMSRSHSRGEKVFEESAADYLRAMLVLAVVTTLAAWLASLWRPSLFGGDLVPHLAALRIALLGIGATIVLNFLVNTLAAAQRPAAAALLNLVFAAVVAGAAVLGTYVAGPRGLYAAVVASGALVIAGGLLYARQAIHLSFAGRAQRVLADLRERRDLATSSVSVYATTAAYAVSLLIVRYTVLRDLGESPAGLLQASLGVSLTVGALLMPMSSLYLTPLLNRDAGAAEKVRTANDFALDVLLLFLLGALPVVLFPRLLLSLLYTSAFAVAGPTLGLFVLWQCCFQMANIYQQLLIGLDDMVFTAGSAVVSFGAAALLAHVLVPPLGLAGAAIALSISAILHGAAAVVRIRVRHALHLPATNLLRVLFVGAAIVGAGLLFAGQPEQTLRGMALRLMYALVALGAFWWRMAASERARLVELRAAVMPAARALLAGRRSRVASVVKQK